MTPKEALQYEVQDQPHVYQVPEGGACVVAVLIGVALILAGVVYRLVDQWIEW